MGFDKSAIARANRALRRAIGDYVPTFRRNQLHELAQVQPPRQHQAQEVLQLDEGVGQTGKWTLQETSNAAAPYLPPRPGGINGAADPLLESQPEGPCPRCRTGRGTVARHHLCRCLQCSGGGAWDDQCPFCVVADVPVLMFPLKTDDSTCPCCCARPGIAKQGHICLCWPCENNEDPGTMCRHCALGRIPLPQPRLDGACPCCSINQGRVAIKHMCLCENCKKIPEATCPFCLFAGLSLW